jgi:hypothetical protein
MSLFSWLTISKGAKPTATPEAATRPEPNRSALPVAPAQRKTERMARRELLYSVVRESMARAGVLSSSYKFKVLSLDAAGRQFLVMVDLAGSERLDAELLSDIETVISQRAKTRHELAVSAVYWRRNDQVGVGASRGGASRPAVARGASVSAAPSQPADLISEPAPMSAVPTPLAAPGQNGYEPIQDDEMEALRAALSNELGVGAAVGALPSRPSAATGAEPTQIMRRPSGFADTERRDDDNPSRTLSPTQAGDLT